MILRTFVEKCRESQLRAIMGQMAQDAWIRGWGGQPNLGNACILGVSVPETPPLHPQTCENIHKLKLIRGSGQIQIINCAWPCGRVTYTGT